VSSELLARLQFEFTTLIGPPMVIACTASICWISPGQVQLDKLSH